MLILGPIGFAVPWVLAALAALPALWVILRAMPPAPRQVKFPAVGLLLGLRDKAPVAHRTPWWLLMLRLAAVAALILAFAGPVWKPVQQSDGTGPLLVVLDAGWSAAPGWAQRQAQAERALGDAAAAGRPAALLIADGRQDGPLTFHSGTELIAGLRAARPAPWPSIWPEETAALLAERPAGALDSLWISDGLDGPQRETLLAALLSLGQVTVIPPSAPVQALSLAPPDVQQATGDPALIWHSLPGAPDGAVDAAPVVLAIGPDPQGTERELARLVAGEVQTTGGTDAISRTVAIDLPPELRNRITRFQIEGQSHAGAVVLADDRVRRHKVGLVGAADRTAEGQQLLSPLHYLRRALEPGSDLVEGGLGDVLNAAPDVIILVDQIDMPEAEALSDWVDRGGMLIRFGGPRMAGSERLGQDRLLPVMLRPGGRDIGGALSWGDPRGLAPFAADGIFAGLAQPEDVEIRAQLMAQPGPELARRSIAALSDNTPLVTRAERGRGQIVLFHVTANAEWSNLPISGLFVQMLDRLIATAGPVAQAEAAEVATTQAGTDPAAGIAVDLTFWAPQLVLDGFGRAEGPGDLAPVAGDDLARGPAPGQPAGIYVAGDRQQALNAGGPLRAATWAGAVIRDPAAVPGRDLMGPLIALAAMLLALDVIGSALLARGGRMATTAALLALMLTAAPRADAQEINPELIRAADEVALAYVITGDEAIDQTSYDGLRGLSQALAGRSSVEPGLPVGINLDDDDLSVLTFLYWPITDNQPAPSPMAYVRLNHFLRSGGMILFDTRDGDIAGLGGPDTGAALQALAAPLDIPPLAPIPRDHVLTRAFYLLDDFPGRWSDPEIWVEAPRLNAEAEEGVPFRHLNDGVTPVVIGGNSWAEAWAVDDQGMSVFPVGRGFEGEQQREMAYRFGVNLIVYALTGNYKSDQVHVPALLERMRDEEVIQ